MKKKAKKFLLGLLVIFITERIMNAFVFHMKGNMFFFTGYIFLAIYSCYVWFGIKCLFFQKKEIPYNRRVYAVPEKTKSIRQIIGQVSFSIHD